MPAKFYPEFAYSLTARVPVEWFNEVSSVAESLGISRHRLLLAALQVGVPLVAAQITCKAAAAAQHRGKE